MGWSREALRRPPLLLPWILAAVLLLSPEAHVDAVVRFLETPPAFSAATTATFKFDVADETNCTACSGCSFSCMLDNSRCFACESKEVTYSGLHDGNHMFMVCVNRSQTFRCASYNWTVDTIPPTAYISAPSSFTNAANVSVRISFSEPCTGGGGFRCSSTYCSLLVYGAGHVLPSTLNVIQPDLDYSLVVSISKGVQSGRLVLAMDKGFCEDNARNSFQQTSNSTFIFHFDRGSVFVNLTTQVPQKLIPYNGTNRTAVATNTVKDLKIYLTFSGPVLNSSEEIHRLLNSTGGLLVPTNRTNHANWRFGYTMQNISGWTPIVITCDTSRIISRQGTPVSRVEPITFLYDDQRPSVRLSTTATKRSRADKIPVLVHFAKPVFGFNDSAIVISGGNMLGFLEISNVEYQIEIQPNDSNVSVQVAENKIADIAGNLNLPSNILQVEHYSIPTISSIVSTTSTAALAITSTIAALLTVSTSSLISSGAISEQYPISDPSSNLVRLVSHVQVFALSRWLVTTRPIAYDEFATGIEWTIPYMRLPWEEGSNYEDSTFPRDHSEAWERSRFRIFKYPSFANQKRPSVNGAQLSEEEYRSSFQNNSTKPEAEMNLHMFNSIWGDFGKNMFWLAVLGGGLVLLHVAILGVLKLKTKNSEKPKDYGALEFPRFEMFLIQLALPCICQASGGIIKEGGKSTGIAVGAVLLGITAAVLISMLVFVSLGITRGKLLQYKEVRRERQEFNWYQDLGRVTLGPGKRGQWTWKGQQNSVNQTILGPLFEDLRGPPQRMLTQIADGGSQAKREDRTIATEDDNDGGGQAKREDRTIATEDDNEVHREGQEFNWYQDLGRETLGPGKRGQGTCKGQQNSVNQTIRGPLFEDLRGPPQHMLAQIADGGSRAKREDRTNATPDDNDGGGQAKREDRTIATEDDNDGGGQSKREDRTIATDDDNDGGGQSKREDRTIATAGANEDAVAPSIENLFGNLRIYYPFLESAKRVALGILAGVYSSRSSKPSRNPSLTILSITSFQLFFLVLKKPFMEKTVQLVEVTSVACEAVLFALALSEKKPGGNERSVGLSMVAMFIVMFATQMLNELPALYRQVLRLDPSRRSFFSGLKRALGGLVLIALPACLSTELSEQLASNQGEGGDSESAVPGLSQAANQGEGGDSGSGVGGSAVSGPSQAANQGEGGDSGNAVPGPSEAANQGEGVDSGSAVSGPSEAANQGEGVSGSADSGLSQAANQGEGGVSAVSGPSEAANQGGVSGSADSGLSQAANQGEGGDSESAISALSQANDLLELAASFSRDDEGPANDPSSSTNQDNRFWSDKRSKSAPVTFSSDFKAKEDRQGKGGSRG